MVSRADSPTSICDGSMVASIGGGGRCGGDREHPERDCSQCPMPAPKVHSHHQSFTGLSGGVSGDPCGRAAGRARAALLPSENRAIRVPPRRSSGREDAAHRPGRRRGSRPWVGAHHCRRAWAVRYRVWIDRRPVVAAGPEAAGLEGVAAARAGAGGCCPGGCCPGGCWPGGCCWPGGGVARVRLLRRVLRRLLLRTLRLILLLVLLILLILLIGLIRLLLILILRRWVLLLLQRIDFAFHEVAIVFAVRIVGAQLQRGVVGLHGLCPGLARFAEERSPRSSARCGTACCRGCSTRPLGRPGASRRPMGRG